jgi:hypothetical protein
MSKGKITLLYVDSGVKNRCWGDQEREYWTEEKIAGE